MSKSQGFGWSPLRSLDSKGANGSSGSFEKCTFLSLSGCAGDTEDDAHLHLPSKPSDPLSCLGISVPRAAPSARDCPLINPNTLNSMLSFACGFFFSRLVPKKHPDPCMASSSQLRYVSKGWCLGDS